jgi:hypothetical protein
LWIELSFFYLTRLQLGFSPIARLGAEAKKAFAFQYAANPFWGVTAPVMNVGSATGWILTGVDGKHRQDSFLGL